MSWTTSQKGIINSHTIQQIVKVSKSFSDHKRTER